MFLCTYDLPKCYGFYFLQWDGEQGGLSSQRDWTSSELVRFIFISFKGQGHWLLLVGRVAGFATNLMKVSMMGLLQMQIQPLQGLWGRASSHQYLLLVNHNHHLLHHIMLQQIKVVRQLEVGAWVRGKLGGYMAMSTLCGRMMMKFPLRATDTGMETQHNLVEMMTPKKIEFSSCDDESSSACDDVTHWHHELLRKSWVQLSAFKTTS